MKFNVVNTMEGLLIPATDEDHDLKRKLKLGRVYEVEVKVSRNYQFHKKYMKLISCAWEYLTEKQRAFFGDNIRPFRKSIEVAAGWFDLCFSMEKKEWYQAPKSISFSGMSQEEFDELYDRVKDVLFSTYLAKINEEEFENILINF